MELFKGLMYQQERSARNGELAGVRGGYGARVLARELAPALGNSAANARWRSGQPAAVDAAQAPAAPPAAAVPAAPAAAPSRPRPRSSRSVWQAVGEQLLFLGGRPMHAGHNLDLDEPFEGVAPAARDNASRRDCGQLLPC